MAMVKRVETDREAARNQAEIRFAEGKLEAAVLMDRDAADLWEEQTTWQHGGSIATNARP